VHENARQRVASSPGKTQGTNSVELNSTASSIDVQSSPIILPPLDARIGQSHVDPTDIENESHITWLRDPAELRCCYVREGVNLRCSRIGRIAQHRDGGLIAYAVLDRDAPPLCGCKGVWIRRTFWIAENDPYASGGYPAEAIDPQTIAPRVPGMVTSRMLASLDELQSTGISTEGEPCC
jgi:hypothetical protein